MLRDVEVHGHRLTLRSRDNGVWFSSPRDLLEYRRGREAKQSALRRSFLADPSFVSVDGIQEYNFKFEPPHKPLPEAGLWAAVFELAVADCRGRCEKKKRAALAWIESTRQGEGSFLWVCDVIGLDAGAVRGRVKGAGRKAPAPVVG